MHIVRSKDPILFFSSKEKKSIEDAIREAELKTSGEIRVHLERKAKADILAHARDEFVRLGMAQTQTHNGILIFIGVASRRFAILGDKGIDNKVPRGFWDEIARVMMRHFREDRFADGLVEAIHMAGHKLHEYFPYQRNDINELPDEISYSL